MQTTTRNAGDLGSIHGSGRSPGEGNDNPLQYSCLENSMDREAWRATVHGVTRVRRNLATKPPPPFTCLYNSNILILCFSCYKISMFILEKTGGKRQKRKNDN